MHGGLVALDQGLGLAPMFVFGFSAIFIVTQMHGLGWSRATRLVIALAWLSAAIWVYAGRGLAKLNEPFRIPFIDYAGVALLTGLLW